MAAKSARAPGPYIVSVRQGCTCEPSVCESDAELYHETSCAVVGMARGDRVVSRVAVSTLEERRVFDAAEWVAAGGDQPDGNERFYHSALILERQSGSGLLADGSREQLLMVLFLHDGRRSAGHFEHMTEPVETPVFGESGGSVSLPDGREIEVRQVTWQAIFEGAGMTRSHMDAGHSREKALANWNAKNGVTP